MKLELIRKRGSIQVQDFKEANCFLRKTLERKAQDLGFGGFSMVIGVHKVKA